MLAIGGGEAQLGFVDGTRGRLPSANASMPRRGTGGPAFAALRPGTVIAVERQGETRRHLCAALDPGNLGRDHRRGGRHGTGAGDAGRLRLSALRLQPRHPGAAPARLLVQAVRLRGGAGCGLDAGVDHPRRSVLREPRPIESILLPQFLGRLCRAADDALGPRAVAQFDDDPGRQFRRHGAGQPHRPADGVGRELSQRAAGGARRRRHDRAADHQCLRDHGQ